MAGKTCKCFTAPGLPERFFCAVAGASEGERLDSPRRARDREKCSVEVLGGKSKSSKSSKVFGQTARFPVFYGNFHDSGPFEVVSVGGLFFRSPQSPQIWKKVLSSKLLILRVFCFE